MPASNLQPTPWTRPLGRWTWSRQTRPGPHCTQWQEKKGYLKHERLHELDAQALAWALFEAFGACPALERVELVEAPEQPGLNFPPIVLVGCFATDPPPADAEPWVNQCHQRFRRYYQRSPWNGTEWMSAFPIRRSDLEPKLVDLAGRQWWAKSKRLQLEMSLSSDEMRSSKSKPRL